MQDKEERKGNIKFETSCVLVILSHVLTCGLRGACVRENMLACALYFLTFLIHFVHTPPPFLIVDRQSGHSLTAVSQFIA